MEIGERIQSAVTALLIIAAIVLGGGQGGLGDTITQMLALLLLAGLLAVEAFRGPRLLTLRSPAWLVLLVVLLPISQMLPLPQYLPMQPIGAERALWSLLPGVAVFLSLLTLKSARQRQLLMLVVILAVASIALGLLQLAGGPGSELRLYENTSTTQAVGFFANRNHLAALLLMCLPFCVAAATSSINERISGDPISGLKIGASVGSAVLVLFGIAVSQSRAGLLLAMIGLMLSLPMALSMRRGGGIGRGFAIIVALALVLTVQFAFYGVLQRVTADPLSDQRWQIAKTTLAAARDNPIRGAGLGTFRQVFEAADTRNPGRYIVNHAHDDYLELWLEAGWPFVAVALCFVGSILWVGASAWKYTDNRGALWAKAASIALMLMLLHSSLDYPLRTTSNQVVFAASLAILLSWRLPLRSKE